MGIGALNWKSVEIEMSEIKWVQFFAGAFSAVAFLSFPVFSQLPTDLRMPRTNVVDLDASAMFDNCFEFPDDNEGLQNLICLVLREEITDDMIKAENFLDQLFVGYRQDIPRFMLNQLDEPVVIECLYAMIDGPGMVLARAAPVNTLLFAPNPFLRLRGGFRAWNMTRFGFMEIDIDDVIFMVLSETLVDVVVHEALHALGHPNNFETSGLNRQTSVFGQVNFVGDPAGVNGVGYGLREYRLESGNPFATFIPLSQNDGAAHLSSFSPVFTRFNEGFQDIFTPTAPPPGIFGIFTRSLQGMFADLGFQMRGINAPGFVDIDGDGIADNPVIVNPILPQDPQP